MPYVSPTDLKRLENLCKEYRILFVGYDEPPEWPEGHRTVQKRVSELGEMKFDSYAAGPSVTDDNPWKGDVNRLASSLAERAKRSAHRNESSWRAALEPFIFARLSGEVACRNCRNRLWRSEIEAACDDQSQRGSAPHDVFCKCPLGARGQDHLQRDGLYRIFSHRGNETLLHEPIIVDVLGKKIQKPAAIFGLRQTRAIENLLGDTQKSPSGEPLHPDGEQRRKKLRPSPMERPRDEKGDELLYPFIILEAKSSSSECDWYSIQLQTAFSIRTFLETQHRLHTAAHSPSHSSSAPLVWLFANRGEHWRLSVAFMAKGRRDANAVATTDYIITEVWRGSITTQDGALQLLLLVDCIFDWARDMYRESIICNLRSLASGRNDAASLLSILNSDTGPVTNTDTGPVTNTDTGPVTNTDTGPVANTDAGPVAITNTGPVANTDTRPKPRASASRTYEHQATMRNRDGRLGIVLRHAMFVESRYCCLFITRDDIYLLLQSTKKVGQWFCRLIVSVLSDNFLLHESAFDAMEWNWTGTITRRSATPAGDSWFHTAVSCTHGISDKWQPARELYVVAVASDAWGLIVESSERRGNRSSAVQNIHAPKVDTNSILGVVGHLRAGTTENTLLACINRKAVKLECPSDVRCTESSRSSLEPARHEESSHQSSSITMAGAQHVPVPVASDGACHDMVLSLYNSLRRGIQEPEYRFLMFSHVIDRQHTLSQGREALYPASADPGALQVPADRCILVHASEKECLYLMSETGAVPTDVALFERLKRTFETQDVYHTEHLEDFLNLATLQARTSAVGSPWNLKNTYGVYFGSSEMSFVLQACGAYFCPTRHGSPRVPDGVHSGGYLFVRRLFPWRKQGFSWQDIPEQQVFFVYKLISSEIKYWKGVAAARNAEGVPACAWCAKSEGQSIVGLSVYSVCLECFEANRDKVTCGWIFNLFQGKPPFDAPENASGQLDLSTTKETGTLPDEQWARILHGYPALEEPFRDMAQLRAQMTAFKECRDEQRRREHWEKTRRRPAWYDPGARKRPRVQGRRVARGNEQEPSRSNDGKRPSSTTAVIELSD